MAKGLDKRDYELWSAIQQLESFGLLPGDDRMISRSAVTKLLESHAEVRAAEAGTRTINHDDYDGNGRERD